MRAWDRVCGELGPASGYEREPSSRMSPTLLQPDLLTIDYERREDVHKESGRGDTGSKRLLSLLVTHTCKL